MILLIFGFYSYIRWKDKYNWYISSQPSNGNEGIGQGWYYCQVEDTGMLRYLAPALTMATQGN